MKRVKKTEEIFCEDCGRKMNTSVKESHLEVNSMLGKIGFQRHLVHCRRCGQGHAPFDQEMQLDEDHKLTKKLKEIRNGI